MSWNPLSRNCVGVTCFLPFSTAQDILFASKINPSETLAVPDVNTLPSTYTVGDASILSEVPRGELPGEQDNAQAAALSMRVFEGMRGSNFSPWVLNRFFVRQRRIREEA